MTQVWKPSVTVAAVVHHEGRFLLVEEHTPDGLRINQPAGHLEFGESLEAGAIREAREETTRDFAPSHLLGVYLMPTGSSEAQATYLRVAYVGTVGPERADRQLDPDILRTVWLSRDEIAARQDQLRSPLVLRCVEDYLAGQRAPLGLVQFHTLDSLAAHAPAGPASAAAPRAPAA